MKKFLLSLVGLFVAFAANAVDYYLIGGFNGWVLKDANCKFTPGSNGEYTLDYEGTLTSGFKINDGKWGNDAANFGGTATLNLGELYTLTAAGSSGNIPLAENIENPHLVFNPTKKTLLISGQSVEAETIYAIHGTIFDATEGWITKDMTEDNGKWTLETTGSFKGQFGIWIGDKASHSQTGWIASAGSATVTLGSPMEVKVDGTNFNLNAGDYTFTFDPEAMTLLVEGTVSGGGDEPDPEGYPEMYLVGEMTGWAKDDAYKMETTDGITYTLNVPEMTDEQFKFFGGTWGTRELTFGTKELENGEYTFTNIPNVNTSLVKGGNVTFTLVQKDDFTSAQVTISGQEEESSNFTKVYLASDRNSFNLSEKFRMKTTDGETYTLNIPDAGSDIAFKFVAKLEDGDKWFSNGEQNIHNGTITIEGNTDRNMTLHTGGDVTFTLNPVDNFAAIKVTIEGQDHDADPYPPIYLVGSMTNWEAEEAYRLTTEDGHTYTITVEDMSSEDDFQFLGTDAHNYWFSNGDKRLVAGTDYELTTGNAEGYDMSLLNGGDVTFTFVLSELHDSATLDIAIDNEVEETHNLTYKLCGGATGTTWKDHQMTKEGDKWTLTLDNALPNFGIREWCLTHNKEKSWINSADEEATANAAGEYPCKEGGTNWTSTLTGKTTYTFDPETMMLDIATEGGDDPIPPVEDEYPEHLYVVGNVNGNGWTPTSAVEMTTASDGVYTLSNASFTGAANFSFITKQAEWGGDLGDRYQDADGDGGVMQPNDEGIITGTLVKNPATDAAFKVAPGIYDMKVDLSTLTLTMTKVGDVPIPPVEDDYPEHLYVVGNVNGNGWTPTSAVEMTTASDGVYTLSNASFTGAANFSFITKQAEWGGDLGDRYQDANGDGGVMAPNAEGVITGTLAKNPAEDAAFQVAPGIYDMKVDLSTLTLTMTKVGDVPIPPVGDDYPEHLYVIGMINDNGWNPSTAIELTNESEGVYTLSNATINGGKKESNFSFTTKLGADADDWAVGDRYQDADGDGGVMQPNDEGIITGTLVKNPAQDAAFQVAPGIYDMTVDLSTLTLTMKKVGNVEIEEPTDTEYYLVGAAFGNWANPSNYKFEKGENGEYTISVDQLSGEFKITDGVVNGTAWSPSYGSNGSAIELGVPYELGLSTSSGNLSFGEDVIKDVKMVFNPSAKTLTVTGTVVEEVEHEYVYYIHGTTSNEATAQWEDVDMTDNGDDNWSLTVNNGFVKFAIVRVDKALNNQQSWIKSAVAPAEGEVVIAAKGEYQAQIEGPSDFTSTLAGKCTYLFNPETMMLTVDGETGISAIEAEEGEAVYYNLQGQRIANPDKGIYIRVVNGKATKVVK